MKKTTTLNNIIFTVITALAVIHAQQAHAASCLMRQIQRHPVPALCIAAFASALLIHKLTSSHNRGSARTSEKPSPARAIITDRATAQTHLSSLFSDDAATLTKITHLDDATCETIALHALQRNNREAARDYVLKTLSLFTTAAATTMAPGAGAAPAALPPVDSVVCTHQLTGIKKHPWPNDQDRHVSILNHDHAFFAVFDGCGSTAYAADFARDNLHNNITASPEFARDTNTALRAGFTATQAGLDPARADGSGTTVAAATIKNGLIHSAWAGDSRVILSRAGRAIALTPYDHNVRTNQKEASRIWAAGGKISSSGTMVLGTPQGATQHTRNIGFNCCKPHVAAEPELRTTPIQSIDDFLVLTSDGVHDRMTNQEIVDLVRTEGFEKAPQALNTAARQRGSRDDGTAIVVDLRKLPAFLVQRAMKKDDVKVGAGAGAQDVAPAKFTKPRKHKKSHAMHIDQQCDIAHANYYFRDKEQQARQFLQTLIPQLLPHKPHALDQLARMDADMACRCAISTAVIEVHGNARREHLEMYLAAAGAH